MNIDLLKWLDEWYESNCNGDWEHNFGISIETLDNPGWNLTADLGYDYDYPEHIDWNLIELDNENWIGYKIENSVFNCAAQGVKLELVLFVFKSMIESKKVEVKEIKEKAIHLKQ